MGTILGTISGAAVGTVAGATVGHVTIDALRLMRYIATYDDVFSAQVVGAMVGGQVTAAAGHDMFDPQ